MGAKRPCSRCIECGDPAPDSFHPYLFCVLYKAGVRDPAEFLARAGWVYDPSRKGSSPAVSS